MTNYNKVPELKINLTYNKKDVYNYLKPFLKSITYTDYIDNHCDVLELSLYNDDYRFSNEWRLDKGSKISCKIQLENQILNCGTFTIDKTESIFSNNISLFNVVAIAIPADLPIRRKNTNFFEKMYITDIAKFYAEKYNFKFITNTEDKGIILERVDQVDISDMKFLSELAYKYGYIFKLTDHTLIFLRLAEQNPIITLNKSLISNIKITDQTSQKSGYIEYYNPEKGSLDFIQIGKTTNNIVQLQQRFRSRGEGQSILAAELKRMSKEKRGHLELSRALGNFNAGADFKLEGFGFCNGVYRITKSVHEISGENGWNIYGEFEECEEITYKLTKK